MLINKLSITYKSSIFFYSIYLLLRECSFRTQKIWKSSTKIRAGKPALIRLQYYLFLMEVEDDEPSKEHYKYTKNQSDKQILHSLFTGILAIS